MNYQNPQWTIGKLQYFSKMLYCCMSAEKIVSTKINDLPLLATPVKNEEVSSSRRVDINVLLNRARKVKEKETITNVIFAGLILTLIFIVGIVLSF